MTTSLVEFERRSQTLSPGPLKQRDDPSNPVIAIKSVINIKLGVEGREGGGWLFRRRFNFQSMDDCSGPGPRGVVVSSNWTTHVPIKREVFRATDITAYLEAGGSLANAALNEWLLGRGYAGVLLRLPAHSHISWGHYAADLRSNNAFFSQGVSFAAQFLLFATAIERRSAPALWISGAINKRFGGVARDGKRLIKVGLAGYPVQIIFFLQPA
jgi:hypothetical protein